MKTITQFFAFSLVNKAVNLAVTSIRDVSDKSYCSPCCRLNIIKFKCELKISFRVFAAYQVRVADRRFDKISVIIWPGTRKMIWLLEIVSEVFFGFQVVYFLLENKIDVFVQVCIGVPLGFGFSSLVFFLSSAFFGMNFLHLIIHTGLLLFAGYLLMLKTRSYKRISLRKANRQTLVFLGASLALAIWIVPCMYFPKPRSVNVSFIGDIHEEISLINSFVHGVNSGFVNIFKVRHPSCYKCVARTRWQTAFHAAMLRIGRASMRTAMTVPSFMHFFAFCFVYLNFANIYLKNALFSLATLVVFLFAGGFGFIHWFWKNPRHDRGLDFVFRWGGKETEWSHPILQYMFAFREPLMSLAVMSSVLYLLNIEDKKNAKTKLVALAGALVGLLPSCEYQVCIGALIYVGLYIFLDMRTRNVYDIVIFFISAGVVASPQLVHYLPRASNAWLTSGNEFWHYLIPKGVFYANIVVWLEALGVFAVISLVVCWFFMDSKTFRMYVPGIVVFVIANHVTFQGYTRFNIKIFYPCWMTVAAVIFVKTLVKFSNWPSTDEKKGMAAAWATVCYICAVASAIIGFVRLRPQSREIWTESMERAGTWIAQNTATKSVFITDLNDFNIISTIAGKTMSWASDRLLWLFGLRVRDDVRRAMRDILYQADSKGKLPKVKYAVYDHDKLARSKLASNITDLWKEVYNNDGIRLLERP